MAVFGVMAEFRTARALVAAARRARAAGYRDLDAYSPLPIDELSAALGLGRSRLGYVMGAAGITGALAGLALQYWVHVIDYPLNVGGKPLFSWPSFVVVCFELAILCAAVAGVVAMLARNGLPSPYHPVFNAPGFERASQDRFFLCIEASDPKFEVEGTTRFLRALAAEEVAVVPR